MSIKSAINALFKLSGGQAMPKYSSPIEHSGSGTYVAPYDGYIQIHGSAIAEFDEAQLSINDTRIANLIAAVAGNWLDFIVPVHKGDNCEVNVTGASSSATVRFYKTMGGEINRLLAQAVRCVRGGVLCLLTSSIHLEHGAKVFSLLKRVGLAIKLSQKRCKELISICQHDLLFRQVTDLLAYIQIIVLTPIKILKAQYQQEFALAQNKTKTLGRVREQFRLKKVRQSLFPVMTLLNSGLFQLRDHNNLNATEVCHA